MDIFTSFFFTLLFIFGKDILSGERENINIVSILVLLFAVLIHHITLSWEILTYREIIYSFVSGKIYICILYEFKKQKLELNLKREEIIDLKNNLYHYQINRSHDKSSNPLTKTDINQITSLIYDNKSHLKDGEYLSLMNKMKTMHNECL